MALLGPATAYTPYAHHDGSVRKTEKSTHKKNRSKNNLFVETGDWEGECKYQGNSGFRGSGVEYV